MSPESVLAYTGGGASSTRARWRPIKCRDWAHSPPARDRVSLFSVAGPSPRPLRTIIDAYTGVRVLCECTTSPSNAPPGCSPRCRTNRGARRTLAGQVPTGATTNKPKIGCLIAGAGAVSHTQPCTSLGARPHRPPGRVHAGCCHILFLLPSSPGEWASSLDVSHDCPCQETAASSCWIPQHGLEPLHLLRLLTPQGNPSASPTVTSSYRVNCSWVTATRVLTVASFELIKKVTIIRK
ncbi:uncharacterized protein C8Q71DRAFT_58731 [Rhodofomes roseus]|uniref:Uncharacterized protein n=1 Tax=Rhodofomes roseus TaxID=34475 RepID=A0ABQ8KG50_9APHY|nr:uncharacterized protein C8Q71DRAFT_58731 [Rhodofomes roseus]KAH9836771.1 hypothetical protein C8Q71DRAFT_58731 [Rhodofomes roseus]